MHKVFTPLLLLLVFIVDCRHTEATAAHSPTSLERNLLLHSLGSNGLGVAVSDPDVPTQLKILRGISEPISS